MLKYVPDLVNGGENAVFCSIDFLSSKSDTIGILYFESLENKTIHSISIPSDLLYNDHNVYLFMNSHNGMREIS